MIENCHVVSTGSRARLLLFFLIIVALIIFSFIELRASIYRSEKALLSAASEQIALRISTELQALLDVGSEFSAALIDEEDNSYTSLKALADTNLPKYPCIDSITIAPAAIVRYAFPEERSSASIGHDLLDNPERMQALVAAVSTKQAVLQGPDFSSEGVQLAFLRIPVFKTQDLWGFVSIAIDVQKMMSILEIRNEFPGLLIACSQSSDLPSSGDQAKAVGEVFWGDDRAHFGYARAIALRTESSGWTVSVASIYPASRAIWWSTAAMGLSIFGLAAFYALSIASRRRAAFVHEVHQAHFEVTPYIEPSETTAHAKSSSIEDINKPCAVLVVDDCEVNRELLVRMLTLKGYRASAVQCGELALNMLSECSFDVMLIDCIMPGMDGYALAVSVRETAFSETIKSPVMIAMSPSHDTEEVNKCEQAGFDGLIIKPFTMTSLDQKIKEILNSRANRAK